MSRTPHDSPYRSEATPAAAARHPARTTRPASPGRHPRPAREAHDQSTRVAHAKTAAPERARPRRRRGSPYGAEPHLTSHPTGRAAYADTRAWLLDQHGPVCAYCGRRFEPGVMTLDHVAPRRGLTAYDRRDNLVLACPGCNAAKRDMAPLAFLLARRSRAAHLLRYGSHLSPMLVDLARSLVPESTADVDAWGSDVDDDLDGESPYRD